MADGRHFEKSLYLHISAANRPNNDEIWYVDANFNQGDGNVTKIQKFPNSR